MTDWDDIRYFLAVARGGSLRAGAEHLGVRHTTVLRRISLLEDRLGARLFEKLPSGYRLTDAGRDVLELAEEMASVSNRLQARVFGRDQHLSGQLRITMTSMLATHLLMPDLAEFTRLYPALELTVVSCDSPLNLTNREADVAIRVVYDAGELPMNLHGLKGPELFGSLYMSSDLYAAWLADCAQPIRWIMKAFDGQPTWARECEVAIAAVPFQTVEAGTHIAAARAGLGMTALPCFVGDADPLLVRAPGANLHRYGTLYLLTQGETRLTKRVRLFTDFISQRLAQRAEQLAGVEPAR